jgi:tetratricopeptide (TPR) repeat protein
MGESFKSEQTVREYLLGRVSDETALEGIEELLFTDEEFSSLVALTEDGIINDFVLRRLDEADAASFRATLAGDPERLSKLELTLALRKMALAKTKNAKSSADTPSFFASLKASFRQPKYVGAFAVLLLAVLVSAIYLTRNNHPDELVELRSIYRQERPTEARVTGFGYAPLEQLRGAPEPREKNRLLRMENRLLEVTEKSSSAEAHHSLGDLYLMQKKYADAIRELDSASKLAVKSAQIHNDLGAAYFELAKASAEEKRFELLGKSLEEFTVATELDGNLLEALFNRSLALQELKLPREAKESWTLYLQKDASSPWGDEARKNLARITGEQTRLRTDEQVLGDFLTAYRNHDDARARQIHDETKGLLMEPSVPFQLSRRYLMAKQRGDEGAAGESIGALICIGNFEQSRNGEFFFLS